MALTYTAALFPTRAPQFFPFPPVMHPVMIQPDIHWKPLLWTALGIGVVLVAASALDKAISYTLTLWDKLTRFLEHPQLELSNNLAENSMRPVALGRKNWIHVGSELAGPKVAAILSVLESCRRLKLPVREYLASVLPGLAKLPVQRVGQYTPAAWAARSR